VCANLIGREHGTSQSARTAPHTSTATKTRQVLRVAWTTRAVKVTMSPMAMACRNTASSMPNGTSGAPRTKKVAAAFKNCHVTGRPGGHEGRAHRNSRATQGRQFRATETDQYFTVGGQQLAGRGFKANCAPPPFVRAKLLEPRVRHRRAQVVAMTSGHGDGLPPCPTFLMEHRMNTAYSM